MKELLEECFYTGYRLCQEESGLTNLITPCTFEEWYEQNKSKIDDAIDSYLESQGKSIVDTERLDMMITRYY